MPIIAASDAIVLAPNGTGEAARVETGGISIGGAGSYGGGTGVLCLKNAAAVPSTNPTNAVLVYSLTFTGSVKVTP